MPRKYRKKVHRRSRGDQIRLADLEMFEEMAFLSGWRPEADAGDVRWRTWDEYDRLWAAVRSDFLADWAERQAEKSRKDPLPAAERRFQARKEAEETGEAFSDVLRRRELAIVADRARESYIGAPEGEDEWVELHLKHARRALERRPDFQHDAGEESANPREGA